MQSVNEFTAGLSQVRSPTFHRPVRLQPPAGIFGRFERQSSMAPVVNAVGAYNAAQTDANMLQLITAIGAIPREKKEKYQHALNALYASFPQDIYVTAQPFSLHVGPNASGIRVIRSPHTQSHQVDAILALQELHNVDTGRTLLHDIAINTTQGNTFTHNQEPRHVAVRAGVENRGNTCEAHQVDRSLTQLTAALHNRRGADVSTEIRAALTTLGHDPNAQGSYDWLQDQINDTPIYQLAGMPSTQPSSATRGNDWISATMLRDWVDNHNFPTGLQTREERDNAEVALGTVLAGATRRGDGTHSIVRWRASNTVSNMGQQRPAFIGLGHELIHAHRNQLGDNPGGEGPAANSVLGEYAAVGLGPFEGATHTENGLRRSANLPDRDRYDP